MNLQDKIDNIDKFYSNIISSVSKRWKNLKKYLSDIVEDRVYITTDKNTHFSNMMLFLYMLTNLAISFYVYFNVFFNDGIFGDMIMYLFKNLHYYLAAFLTMVMGGAIFAFCISIPFILHFYLPVFVELFITYLFRYKIAAMILFIVLYILL